VSWANSALAIQQAKVLRGGTQIRKVFFVDDQSEFEPCREILEKQMEAGLDLRYLQYKKIDSNTVLSDLSKVLASRDFGIFDHQCVLIWNLNNQRDIVNGELIVNTNEISNNEIVKYERFFTQLWNASTPLALRPSEKHKQSAV
jgi:hypothetical protein